MDIIQDINIPMIKELLKPYLDSMYNFQFSFYNSLFWVIVLTLFLILLRFWTLGKSFSFCGIISLVLLGTTKLESYLYQEMMISSATLAPFLIRVGALFIIAVVFLYYTVVKDD